MTPTSAGQEQWTYRDWNLPYGEPDGQAIAGEVARARYEAGQDLTVLVGPDPDHPQQVLTIMRSCEVFKVVWLDALHRRPLSHVYAVRPESDWPRDRLLLENVHVRRYDHAQPPPDGISSYDETTYIHPTGIFATHRSTRGVKGVVETSGSIEKDLLPTLPVPAFGEWEPLLVGRTVPTDDPPQDLGLGLVRGLRVQHPEAPETGLDPLTVPLGSGGRPVEGVSADQGEVMAMRDVQLADLPTDEAVGLLDELAALDDTWVVSAAPTALTHLVGTALVGRRLLYVPVQSAPVPEPVLARARELDITIRLLP